MNQTGRTATGAWAEDEDSSCESLAECGASDPVRAEITQSGRSVTATVTWDPDITFAATTGTVAGDGTVTLTWDRVLSRAETGGALDIRLQMAWTVRISGDRLTGELELTTTAEEVPGGLTGTGCLGTAAHDCSGLERAAAP